MSIIAILIALLVPVLGAARTRVLEGRVRAEFGQLEQGVTDFKATFYIDPPSHITLYEKGADWDTRSRAIISQLWPQYDFANHDFNNNGDVTETFPLNGAECLVFFLGGLPDTTLPTGTTGPLRGFSKNPSNPFEAGGSRLGPFFEFDPARLVPHTPNDQAIIRRYRDTLQNANAPILYFSSNNGAAYDATDNPQIGSHYLLADGVTPWRPQSFQLISPGGDGDYGTGGVYDPDDTAALSAGDQDNITNFQSGRLAPR